jgi:HEAT repeat protein
MSATCHSQKRYQIIVLVYLASFIVPPSSFGFDPVIDSPMYHMPDVPMPPEVYDFPEGLKELWLRALERPEADIKCKAADAIAEAHQRGMKGLQTTIGPLVAALDQPDQHPLVRLALARTLIVLEARQAAPSLFRQSQIGSSDLRERVEPALARWDYQPARAVWLERLRKPDLSSRDLILAIRGLATVQEERAVDPLREIVFADQAPGPIRLESARALGSLRSQGLEKDAKRLAASSLSSPQKGGELKKGKLVSRLAAVSLLQRHSSPEAVRLLQQLMRDPEPAVAAPVAARLLEIDPQLVVPAVGHLLASPDACLRCFAVDALGRQPNFQHIHLLGDRLDDEHLAVRAKARRYLQELAKEKKWRAQVLAAGTRMLQTQQWRGLEQAIILLTQLDHKPAAERFLKLLTFDRLEVSISAAWGVRKLDVPETLPHVLRFVEAHVRRLSEKGGDAPAGRGAAAALLAEFNDHVFSQLHQFLGQRKYRPADAVLRWFIPKFRGGPEARAAAIWALGLIHEGEMPDALAAALEERLNDIASMPPEWKQVRLMCAVALGRMKARKALPSLRKHFVGGELSREPVHNACAWAVAQITGTPLPSAKPIHKMQRNWFLTPQ